MAVVGMQHLARLVQVATEGNVAAPLCHLALLVAEQAHILMRCLNCAAHTEQLVNKHNGNQYPQTYLNQLAEGGP